MTKSTSHRTRRVSCQAGYSLQDALHTLHFILRSFSSIQCKVIIKQLPMLHNVKSILFQNRTVLNPAMGRWLEGGQASPVTSWRTGGQAGPAFPPSLAVSMRDCPT